MATTIATQRRVATPNVTHMPTFFPPMKLSVAITMPFLPLKELTSKLLWMWKVSVSPFLKVLHSSLPYSFRKWGTPAKRIHTMKCSSIPPPP